MAEFVIAIDGPAGAGKTTLAHDIKLALAQRYSVTEIHMDDLYDGWDNALTHQLTDVLTNLVAAHKKSAAISLSTYDWRAGAFSPVAEIEKSDLLILEGVGSGQMAVRDSLAALIWIDIEESEIWFVGHIVSYESPRHYYHVISVFDSHMNLLRYSAPFKFEGDPIEYCLSIVVEDEIHQHHG